MSSTTRNPTRFIPGKEKRPESLIPDETYIVKVKGFPWWPVMILDNEQVTQNTKSSLKKQNRNIEGYYFHYFHTFEYGYEDISQFRVFNPEKWKFQLEQNLIDRIDHRAAIRQALNPEQFLSDRKANIEREFAYEAGIMGKEEYELNEVELTRKEESREEYEKKILAVTKDVHKREIKSEPRSASEVTHKKQQLKSKKHIYSEQQSSEIQMEQTAAEPSMSTLSNASQVQEEQQQQSEVETEKANQQLNEHAQPALVSASADTNGEQEKEKSSEMNEMEPLQEQPQNERQNHAQKSENIPTQHQRTDGRCSSTGGVKREIAEQNETQKPQIKRKRRNTNDGEPLIEIQDIQQQQEVQSLPDVAIVPRSPEYKPALTTYTMDRQLPEIPQSVGESNIIQSDKIQFTNDTMEPIGPITTIHENSTDPKPEIKSTTPMKTDDNEEQVELVKTNADNDITSNSSIHQVTQDPNFKRAITIKYRLQKILSKHENTKEWPVNDNRLMKVAIQDIRKSQLSKPIVQTLHLGHWVSKASKYTFTMDKDKFDYKTELNNILLHWDVQANK